MFCKRDVKMQSQLFTLLSTAFDPTILDGKPEKQIEAFQM